MTKHDGEWHTYLLLPFVLGVFSFSTFSNMSSKAPGSKSSSSPKESSFWRLFPVSFSVSFLTVVGFGDSATLDLPSPLASGTLGKDGEAAVLDGVF